MGSWTATSECLVKGPNVFEEARAKLTEVLAILDRDGLSREAMFVQRALDRLGDREQKLGDANPAGGDQTSSED